MKSTLIAFPAALALAMLPLASVAQTRFCIGGDLEHLSTAQRNACYATLNAVRNTASALHAPDGWHFVVVCGEDGWKQYAAFSERGEDAVQDASADTDVEEHVTFFREERLHAPQPHALQRVVAHEIAAILLKTEDENAIQTQMATWERQSQTQQAALR